MEHIEELYAGIRLACEVYGVDLVGEIPQLRSPDFVISVTCIGEAKPMRWCVVPERKPTDLICVSGDLGAAYMGLQLLERENKVAAGSGRDFQNPISQARNIFSNAS